MAKPKAVKPPKAEKKPKASPGPAADHQGVQMSAEPSTSTEGHATLTPAAPTGRAAKDERRRPLEELERVKADPGVQKARQAVNAARDTLIKLVAEHDRARTEAQNLVARAEADMWDAEQKRSREIARIDRELLAVTPA